MRAVALLLSFSSFLCSAALLPQNAAMPLECLLSPENEYHKKLFQYCETHLRLVNPSCKLDQLRSGDLSAVFLIDKGLLIVFADHILNASGDGPETLLIPQNILESIAGLQFWALQKPQAIEYDDRTVDFLEQSIPELAEAAFKKAYWEALASGSSVLIARDGSLLEICPDGTEKFIKKIPPSIPMTKGQKIEIK